MESWLPAVVSVILVFSIFLYWVPKPSKAGKHLPSPLALPIIGHLRLLGHLPHQSLFHLSKRYGPLFSLRLGAIDCLVASSPEMAMEFLKTHDVAFASRPKITFARLVMYDEDMVWAKYGPRWKEFKKVCTQGLFSNTRLEETKHIRQEEISNTIESMVEESKGNRAIKVYEKLSNMEMNIVTRMAMGKTYFGKENSEGADWIRAVIEEVVTLVTVFNVGDFVPILSKFDLQGYERRMKAVRKELDAFLERIIQKHKQQSRKNTDLMDLLISGDFSHEAIKAFVIDIVAAGTDTAVVTTEWALAEILRSPTVMQKAQNEIDQVVGLSRRVEEEDLPDLKYLQAIVKEAFRLHPASPLLLPHESMEESNVGGYQIPKGTRVFVNIWAIGRDPSIWDEPEAFNPDRFMGSSVDVRGRDFELIPFGSGRRMCPGYTLALCMVQLALARLLQSLDWIVPEGQMLDMTETFKGTMRLAHPLQPIATSRANV